MGPATGSRAASHIAVVQGWEFGRLVAGSILTAFFTAHAGELGRLGHSLRDMTEFTGQIADAVRHAIHPVLYKRACATARDPRWTLADDARCGAVVCRCAVQQHHGVTYALLIVNDSIIPAMPGSAAELDRLGVLANIGAFQAAARDASALQSSRAPSPPSPPSPFSPSSS